MINPNDTSSLVDKELYEPSNIYGLFSLLKNLIPLLIIYSLVPLVADISILLAWCFSPVIGLFIYRLTMVMHDCGHITLFTFPQTNNRIGILLGTITGIDFNRFRKRHWEHHNVYGKEGDPQGFHYIGIEKMTKSAFVWHLIKPLFGFNLRYVIAESYLYPDNLMRSVRNGEIALIAISQLLIIILVTGFGRHLSLAILPMISAITFGLFFSQLRGIAEQGDRFYGVGIPQVRSHTVDFLGKIFLYDLNFNYHKEHHEQPSIPSRNLYLLHINRLEKNYIAPTMWQTLTSFLRIERQAIS